jgi:hypothetical protein
MGSRGGDNQAAAPPLEKMSTCDKVVIEHWLALYNRLTNSTFVVTDWPDADSSRKNVDATCRDSDGRTMAIEHTLIEPFENEKSDAARFMKTLGTLENHPALVKAGYCYSVSQPVGGIPNGIKWGTVPNELLARLPSLLTGLSDGSNDVVVELQGWSLRLQIEKMPLHPGDPGKFLPGRIYPGDASPELMLAALRRKIPKLSAAVGDRKILLLEKDAAAGTIESQFGKVHDLPEVKVLLAGVDEVWSVNTACLVTENVIFTNRIAPLPTDRRLSCSLNVLTGSFWQVSS